MKTYVGTVREYAVEEGCHACTLPVVQSGRCITHSTITGYRWRTFTADGRDESGEASTHAEAWAEAEGA